MKKTIKLVLLSIAVLFINGCLKDETYYINSEYSKINIADLRNMTSLGYQLEGPGKINFKDSYWYLYFCKENRYKYVSNDATEHKIYEGSYTIDLAKNEIIMKGDDLDSNGEYIQGTIKTKNGYIEQKKIYTNKGLGLEFNDLHQINSSDCTVARDSDNY